MRPKRTFSDALKSLRKRFRPFRPLVPLTRQIAILTLHALVDRNLGPALKFQRLSPTCFWGHVPRPRCSRSSQVISSSRNRFEVGP
jgi:hypothetical protein